MSTMLTILCAGLGFDLQSRNSTQQLRRYHGNSPPAHTQIHSAQTHAYADIIHYASRQLRRYRGNLSAFVKEVPEAESYYKLASATLRFRCACMPYPALDLCCEHEGARLCTVIAHCYGALLIAKHTFNSCTLLHTLRTALGSLPLVCLMASIRGRSPFSRCAVPLGCASVAV